MRNTTPIYPYVGNPDYNLITAMADEAIDYMDRVDTLAPGPAFLRLLRAGRRPMRRTTRPRNGWTRSAPCTSSTTGWNKLRDTIFANQKRLGVIPENAELTPWPADLLKNWDELYGGREEVVHPSGRRLRAPISPTPTTRSAG